MNDWETGSSASNTDDRHPVDLLAEEFAHRIRTGENPQIDDYAKQNPEHAELIRSVFPSIAMVERVSNRADQQRKSDSNLATAFSPQAVPESLGDFQLVREIGRGGMGVVYEAIQLSLKRRVALKVIGSISSGSEKQLARFRREAEAAASLHHTHIVPVYGIGEDQGVQYYAMQLIDGVTLSEVIHYLQGDLSSDANSKNQLKSQASFSTAEAAQLLLNDLSVSDMPTPPISSEASIDELTSIRSATQVETHRRSDLALTEILGAGADSIGSQVAMSSKVVVSSDAGRLRHEKKLGKAYYRNIARIISNVADALQYAHHQGVLHRDIKPGNLLLDRGGIVWVTDFGLARLADCAGMTQTGEIVGTLRYMAPEQLRGQADPRTDIYSLGLTLFELLTLQPAIEQPQSRLYLTDPQQVMAQMHSLNPEIPSDLQTITLKACSHESNHRYQSAGELEEDLRRFLEDRPILARRTTRIERFYRWSRRNPTIAALSSATLLLLIAIAGLLGIFNQRKQFALDAISKEFNRAEVNLREKTAALSAVEKERARAEFNLNLAVQAFDTVIANIAGRGGSDLIRSEISEESEVDILADATLSDADVVLLETLLGFFDRFSAENAKDLSGQAADARRRVGDIQHRLGRLDDAERSYQLALEAFRSKSIQDADDAHSVYVQAEILNELLVIAAKRGQMPKAMEHYEEARRLLEQSNAIRGSTDGRFVLAKTHNNLAAIGYKYGRPPAPRPRGPLVNRFTKPFEDSIATIQKSRLHRETQANGEALQILTELTAESPESTAYQIAYAQALRDEFRIARLQNNWKRADESLLKAITILEQLEEKFPESDAFKYELASTLSISVTNRPNEMARFARSMKLCDELVEKHPNVPEYRTLRGQTLDKAGDVGSGRQVERIAPKNRFTKLLRFNGSLPINTPTYCCIKSIYFNRYSTSRSCILKPIALNSPNKI